MNKAEDEFFEDLNDNDKVMPKRVVINYLKERENKIVALEKDKSDLINFIDNMPSINPRNIWDEWAKIRQKFKVN